MPHELNDHFKDECRYSGSSRTRRRSDTDAAAAFTVYMPCSTVAESAGIAVSDGSRSAFTRHGAGAECIKTGHIASLTGHIAVGHVRYSTRGSSSVVNAQPMVFHYLQGMVGLTYNGNLVNAEVLRQQLSTYGSVFQTTTDTEIIANLLARYSQDPMEQAMASA